MTRAGLTALVMLVATSANERELPFYTGNDLFDLCKRSSSLCVGYAMGVHDMMSMLQMSGTRFFDWRVCLPAGVTARQVADVATRYLTVHPEKRHFGAVAQVAEALSDAFPCSP